MKIYSDQKKKKAKPIKNIKNVFIAEHISRCP